MNSSFKGVGSIDKTLTRNAALVLCDDLAHIRNIVSDTNVSASEIRRISALLRRMLIEGEIFKIAGPRIGKISIMSPDFDDIDLITPNANLHYLLIDNFYIFGSEFSIIYMITNKNDDAQIQTGIQEGLHELSSKKLSHFLKQKIAYYNGNWLNRSDFIKYVANIGHAVHSLNATDEKLQLIGSMRNRLKILREFDEKTNDPITTFESIIGDYNAVLSDIHFNPNQIDIALLCLLSTCNCLVNSPDIKRLEQSILTDG